MFYSRFYYYTNWYNHHDCGECCCCFWKYVRRATGINRRFGFNFCEFNLVFFHFNLFENFLPRRKRRKNRKKSDPLTEGKFLFLVNKRIVRVFVYPTNHSYHLAGAINNEQNPIQKKLKLRQGDVPNWRRFTKARQIAVHLTFEVTKIVKHSKTFSSAPSLCLDTFDSVSFWWIVYYYNLNRCECAIVFGSSTVRGTFTSYSIYKFSSFFSSFNCANSFDSSSNLVSPYSFRFDLSRQNKLSSSRRGVKFNGQIITRRETKQYLLSKQSEKQ